jgi:NDP-sugar pyrophosphorylase family protein
MPARALTVILAAGEGKRMHSILPKVLHRVGRKPLVEHVVQTALKAGLGRVIVVVGHRRDMVIEALVDYPVDVVVQADQRGTGHAMQMVAETVGNYDGFCLVVPGDAPFLCPKTMQHLVDFHGDGNFAATILTAEYSDPTGYGRIVRDASGEVERIVEHGDATADELSINEINSSVYVFDYRRLKEVLRDLSGDNQQSELYLTDTIASIRATGGHVGATKAENAVEVMGINDHAQLREAERIYREMQPAEPEPKPKPRAEAAVPVAEGEAVGADGVAVNGAGTVAETATGAMTEAAPVNGAGEAAEMAGEEAAAAPGVGSEEPAEEEPSGLDDPDQPDLDGEEPIEGSNESEPASREV